MTLRTCEHFLRWLNNPTRERQTRSQPPQINADAAGAEAATCAAAFLAALFMSASTFSFLSPAQSAVVANTYCGSCNKYLIIRQFSLLSFIMSSTRSVCSCVVGRGRTNGPPIQFPT